MHFYLIFSLLAFITACSMPKDIIYFQGIDHLSPEQLDSMSQSYSIKITNDDLLSINVTGWNPEVATPFNPPVFAYSTTGVQPLETSESLYTYLVDQNGDIKFPVL